jgi:hypothetical protein
MVKWKPYCSELQLRSVAALVLGTISLSGCGSDPSADLTTCQESADRFFPGYQAANVDSPRSQFIIGCMASKSHQFYFLRDGCDTKRPLITQPSCYSE